MSFTGLVEPTPEYRAHVERQLAVCDSFTEKDVPDLRKVLVTENDPETWGYRKEWQKRNDCQPTAAAGGLEVIEKRTKNKRGEVSASYLFNASELAAYGRIGMNTGTPMHSGIEVLVKDGAPLEAEYSYDKYTGNLAQFSKWKTPAVMASAATRKLAKATPAPSFKTMCVLAALGQPLHWGTFWPWTPGPDGIYRKYHGKHGDMAHATEGVFAVILPSGEWVLKIANSHNDGYKLISEEFYEEARDARYTPYGAFVLYGTDDPIRDHVNWLTEGFRG